MDNNGNNDNKTFDDELRALMMSHKNDDLKRILKTLVPTKLIIGNEGTTLLHLAARYDNVEMIDLSLSWGCDPTARNVHEATPLHLAIHHEKFEAATRLLLNSAADALLAIDADGKSTLQLLNEKKTRVPKDFIVQFFDQLMTSGIDVESMAEILTTAGCSLTFALLYAKDAEITRALLQRRRWVDHDESNAALEQAVNTMDLKNLKVLVHQGPGAAKRKKDFFKDFYRRLDDSSTLEFVELIIGDLIYWTIDEAVLQFLQRVFEKKSRRVVRMFLQHGVDLHAANDRQNNNNLLPHVFGNPNGREVIDLLMEYRRTDFEVNRTRGQGGVSALHVAVMNGLAGNVKLLLNMGADPNVRDDRGRTPLLCSNAWLSQPIAEHLFDDVKQVSCRDDECIAEILLRYGADIQVVDDSERTVIEVFYYLSSMEPILARLAVAEARGTTIDRVIRERIAAKDGYKDFYDKCLIQIEDLRNYKVTGTITLLDVLTEKIERIDVRQRRIVDAMLVYCDERQVHRVYTTTLKRKLEMALRLHQLRCRAANVIAESLDMMITSDHLVIEMIVGFLSCDDLMAFQ